ncbi:MAG TPA: hypothetical protein VER83_04660 [Candidatus Nanopelagicales bacterium]|nr:hypothetical protein [Candidatus Nanopelagicales bacterium]
MDDELDPRLEASLRAALHHEADSVPLLIRSDDIERARRRRGGRRLALPASLLAAAAAIAVLVIVGGAWRANQAIVATSPSPSLSAADPAGRELESMADLRAAIVAIAPSMPVVALGEHLDAGGETGPITIDVGLIGAYRFMNAAYDCAGGDITIAVMDGEAVNSSFRTTCGTTSNGVTDGIGSAATGNRVVVTADAAVRWRIVVSAMPATPAMTPAISPTCVPLSGGFTGRSLDLRKGRDMPIPIDSIGTLAWHTFEGTTVAGDAATLPALGGPLAVNLADGLIVDPGQHCFDMSGVEADILSFADYEAARTSGTAPSFTGVTVTLRPDGRAVTVGILLPGSLPAGGQVIRFKAAWHRSDGKEDTETWLIPVEVTRTGIGPVLAYEDLAVYAEGTVELLRAEHAATRSADRTVAGDVGAARNVEVVLSCDTGTVTIAVRGGHTTDPASTSIQDCGQGGASVVLASSAPEGTSAELLVDAPAGTTWRLIAYDHDTNLKPSIEEALPLPAPNDGQTVQGVIMSVIAGGAPPSTIIEVYARAQGTIVEVVYACEGAGNIHVTVEGLTKDAACSAAGSLAFTPSGFGPSALTVTSDLTVRLHLELRSSAP